MNLLRKILRRQRGTRGEGGQSLVEAAMAMPLLLAIGFNAINFGYFWTMVMVLSTAPRMGAQYATQGGAVVQVPGDPTTTQVSNLVYQNTTGEFGGTTANVQVRVCSKSQGVTGTGSSQVAQCTAFGPSLLTFGAVPADPEAPLYVLDTVDVAYTFKPPIPGPVFGVVLPSNLTFHRATYMRSLF
jgi:Flp pilus assembly protein TadG